MFLVNPRNADRFDINVSQTTSPLDDRVIVGDANLILLVVSLILSI
jgi:hypothetical protein